MNRGRLIAAPFLALAIGGLLQLLSRSAPETEAPATVDRAPREQFIATAPGAADDRVAELHRQVTALTDKLAAEADRRRQLEERLDSVSSQLAMLASNRKPEAAGATPNPTPAGNQAAPSHATEPGAADHATPMNMERALVAAGLDTTTAADIKRKQDDLTMSEMYLRDRATREQWVDTPRFAEEKAAIDRQRTSIRDEIGDDSYDRYLAALGEPNRVRVDDVLMESAASQAGLQPGDLVLRYGDTRIFALSDLVNATRAGNAGEPVQVEILRQGQPIQVEVPRGPLGLRITSASSQ